MLRLAELALFLVPFVVFAIWRFTAFDAGVPLKVLIGAACLLAVLAAVLVWLSEDQALPPGAAYQPARLEDGKVVSGHAQPQ